MRYRAGILFIALVFFIGACGPKEEVSIEHIVPTRTGVGIRLTRPAWVESVSVQSGNKVMVSQKIRDTVSAFLVDFHWEKGRKYTFCVECQKASLSKEAGPFEGPLFFKLGDDTLGEPPDNVEVAKINAWSKVLYEEVVVSPQGRIAVGSFDRTVRVYDSFGRLLWKHTIPSGVVRCVRFSPSGDYLLAGEASPDGKIYAFDADSGALCWKYATGRDLGTTTATHYGKMPKICSITVVKGTVYVGASKNSQGYVTVGGRKIKYWPKTGIVYAFDLKTGKLVWRFPKEGTMDTAPLKISVDERGRYLAFGGWGGSANGRVKQDYPENTLYVLDAARGVPVWTYSVSPLKKYGFESVSIGGNSHISPGGKYVACCSSDGRFFLFDMEKSIADRRPHPIYEKEISSPLNVSGIPIYAYGGRAFVGDDGAVLLTVGRTYVAPAGKGIAQRPEVKHPRENSIIQLDAAGKVRWVWYGKGPIETPAISKDGRYVVVAVCHNYIAGKKDMAGVYCFDLRRAGGGPERLLWFAPTEGIGVACGISPDGRIIGAIEGPVDMDPRNEYQNIVGRHRVIILS